MSKIIKVTIDDKTHERLKKKAERKGVLRQRLYAEILKEGSKK